MGNGVDDTTPVPAEPGPEHAHSAALVASPSSPASSLPPSSPSARINVVSYRSASIKVIIDPALSVSDVVRHLCTNATLGIRGSDPNLFTLRDEADNELVTDDNLAGKIQLSDRFRLCPSPMVEAAEMVYKLATFLSEDRVLKIVTYTLQRQIRERPFAREFIARGGLHRLMDIVLAYQIPGPEGMPAAPAGPAVVGANTIAYTLVSVQQLVENFDDGWADLNGDFIQIIVQIIARVDRINVCRPAMAILKKLVASVPKSSQDNTPTPSGESTPTPLHPALPSQAAGSSIASPDNTSQSRCLFPDTFPSALATHHFGYELIHLHIAQQPDFFPALVQRLGSSDTTLRLYSFSLLTTLVRSAPFSHLESLLEEIDVGAVVSAVSALENSDISDEMSKMCLLEMHRTTLHGLRYFMSVPVGPKNKRHVRALSYLWVQAHIPEISAPDPYVGTGGTPAAMRFATAAALSSRYKWRRLGFSSENVAREFTPWGWFALRCCQRFVQHDPQGYRQLIRDQLARPADRRWPFGQASVEVTDILVDVLGLSHPAESVAADSAVRPYVFSSDRLHKLVLLLFRRLWDEGGATANDFSRMAGMVRTQVRASLTAAHGDWNELEKTLSGVEYQAVQEQYMGTIGETDEVGTHPSVRPLREQMYRDNYAFVRRQRLQCLLAGAWFLNPAPTTAPSPGQYPVIQGNAMWRFYRLAPDERFLHFCESAERKPKPVTGLEALPGRIDLDQVTEISVSNLAQQIRSHFDPDPAVGDAAAPEKQSAPDASANLTFGLFCAQDTLVAELRALNQAQFSEWVDGLSMLRGGGNVVRTRNTADYIHALTEVAVQAHLFDLTGEQLALPPSSPAPYIAPLDLSSPYYYYSGF